MIDPSRRRLLQTGVGMAAGLAIAGLARATDTDAQAGPLTRWLRHPLLVNTLYRHGVSSNYDADGAAGANVSGYRWIEEQRQGAEWIVRGYAENKSDWISRGWQQLDWGLKHQQRDGGFASGDPFHSTSFFVEALARSCLIDPASATASRITGLRRAAGWLMSPAAESTGLGSNQPYTHRRYILAAAFGQAAAVVREQRFADKAHSWLNEGLALQQAEGVNPEKGGFDAGYQMVGVLMAMRYLPNCASENARDGIDAMVRKAIGRELRQQQLDGSIDAVGSTRIEKETARNGKVKDVPYAEILQALVFASQAFNEPAWLAAAQRIAVIRRW